MKANKQHYGINIGSVSILMIFLILCLISFATLSIVSANADYKLGKKVADRTLAYYNACNEAEDSIASIDETLRSVYNSVNSSEEYFDIVGSEKTFLVTINEVQSLEIILKFQYPESDSDSFYSVAGWQLIITGDLEYDDHLNVLE